MMFEASHASLGCTTLILGQRQWPDMLLAAADLSSMSGPWTPAVSPMSSAGCFMPLAHTHGL